MVGVDARELMRLLRRPPLLRRTRRQHHVWRSYLEAWSTDQIIFCLRDGRIFPSNVSGVEVDHKLPAFYQRHIQGVRWLIGNTHPSAQRLQEAFLTAFGFPGLAAI